MNALELRAYEQGRRDGYKQGYYQGVRDGATEAHKLTADEQARRIAAAQDHVNNSGEKAQGAASTRSASRARKP
jgi:flagellar biosynthesis/type III secretory pathway protein FliH